MMLRMRHSASDWSEAIGASALVHIIAAVLIFDLAGDLKLRTPADDAAPATKVTSLVLGADNVTTATDTGEGSAALIEQSPDATKPVTPETLKPVSPLDETETSEDTNSDAPDAVDPYDGMAAVEPSLLRPVETNVPLGGASVVGAGTSAVAPERVGALQTMALIDTTPGSEFPANSGTGSDPTTGEMNELVRRIRAQLSESCLLAIPQETGAEGSELLMLGNTDTEMRAFADAVLADMTPRPGERSVLVDNRQCGALNYIRQSAAYPTFRLTLGLDAQTVNSGENLSGTIGGIGGRYVSLVLVDDNGVVQEVGEYLTFRNGFARFDMPVTRSGLSRDTSQLLVAFGSAGRPATVDEENGQLAGRYFAALREELGPSTPMALIPFNIRTP